MTAGFRDAYRGPVTLPPLPGGAFEGLYGAVPAAPDMVGVTRTPLPEPGLERLVLSMELPRGRFQVDAALWLPDGPGPFPVLLGLDFLGPVGMSAVFPLDPQAIVQAPGGLGPLTEAQRGTTGYRWPVAALRARGYGVLVSCYGSWVPDSPVDWRSGGVVPCLGGAVRDAGAVSIWGWALMRLMDAACQLPEIDSGQVAVAGHSRLGKAAVWAAAQDTRIAAVWANQSGCCGAAPEAHPVGETRAALMDRFPHWLRQGGLDAEGLDQHQLLARIAPRKVYLSGAMDDLWADPLGSYLALVAGAPAWGRIGGHEADGGKMGQSALAGRRLSSLAGGWPDVTQMWRPGGVVRGPLGWHLRSGVHDMLRADWVRFLRFLDWNSHRQTLRNPQ